MNECAVATRSVGENELPSPWLSTGGTVLPFYARNFTTVRQWIAAVAPPQLMPTILALRENNFRGTPEATPQNRRLTPQADKMQSFGIDLARALTGGHGLVWAAVEEGQTIPRSRTYGKVEGEKPAAKTATEAAATGGGPRGPRDGVELRRHAPALRVHAPPLPLALRIDARDDAL